jgi:acetyl-CoA carboxylase biotin carboxyl carrier protein
MGNVSEEDLETLVEQFDSSAWLQLRVEFSGFTIELSKRSSVLAASATSVGKIRGKPQYGSPADADPQRGGRPIVSELRVPDGWLVVRARNLGTFHRAANPGAKPCVEVGAAVMPNTEVCVIQVMNLFTCVTAGVHGIVRQIGPLDGELIEYDQALFVIEPSALEDRPKKPPKRAGVAATREG